MAEIPDALAVRMRALFGARVEAHGEHATRKALEALVDAEAARRGEPDPVSGAVHALALTHGALMKKEYDLSTHGHHAGWEVGALVVDIKALIRVNLAHGFPAGDAVLRAVARALEALLPTGKVVRLHPDAFAVLLPPSSEVVVEADLEPRARQALGAQVPALLAEAGGPQVSLDYTVALLALTLVKPSHWQVLGPLIWAECERALSQAGRGVARGIQCRRIDLDGAV
jgi:GGDEF domain-containing protein